MQKPYNSKKLMLCWIAHLNLSARLHRQVLRHSCLMLTAMQCINQGLVCESSVNVGMGMQS